MKRSIGILLLCFCTVAHAQLREIKLKPDGTFLSGPVNINPGQLTIQNVAIDVAIAAKAPRSGIIYAETYGFASSNTAAANTTALNASVAALPADGGKIILPAATSTFAINAVAIQNRSGIIIEGQGPVATVLQPSAATSGGTVLKLSNCRDMVVRDLRINGASATPPAALIESRVEEPRSQVSYNNRFENLVLGSDSSNSQVDAIRFTADPTEGACANADDGCDQNNEQHAVANCRLVNSSRAGLSIEHSNSLIHKITGGEIYGSAIGVRTAGGSFTMIGTSLIAITDVQFDFQDGQYRHPIFVTNVNTEQCAKILRTSESEGIRVFFSGYNNTGTSADVAAVDFNSIAGSSNPMFVMTNSYVLAGQTGVSFDFASAATKIRLANSYLSVGAINAPADADLVETDMIASPISATNHLRAIKVVTAASYEANVYDDFIWADATSNNVAIVLSGEDGKVFRIQRKDATGHTVTVGIASSPSLFTLAAGEHRDVMMTSSYNGSLTTIGSNATAMNALSGLVAPTADQGAQLGDGTHRFQYVFAASTFANSYNLQGGPHLYAGSIAILRLWDGNETMFAPLSVLAQDTLGTINFSASGVTKIKPPTDCAGLASGTLYNNSGTPAICP